jgi:hypothetical protein
VTDVQALRTEIELTRAQLGETVQALAARADVRGRLHEAADEARARLRERARDVAPYAVPAAAAVGVVVLALVLLRRRWGR